MRWAFSIFPTLRRGRRRSCDIRCGMLVVVLPRLLALLVVAAAAVAATTPPPGAMMVQSGGGGPHPLPNATATPSRVSIEFGGSVTVVHHDHSALLPPPPQPSAAETCTLTRLYNSGGYALTRQKLGPSFKHCCEVVTPATRINSTAVRCHLPGGIATEGNTSVSTSVGFAYVRHYAAFAPEFSRRPYYRETDGAVIVRVAHAAVAEHGPLLFSATLPCGLPPITAVALAGQLPPPSPTPAWGQPLFATYRLSFPLGGATATTSCYEAVNLTLHGPKVPATVVRTRTFIRAPPPKPSTGPPQRRRAGGTSPGRSRCSSRCVLFGRPF